MKKQVFKEKKLVKQLNRFVQKQDGVYSIMMAGMGATLLAIIAFAVDGSGIILDQARLSDSLEQATLAVTAENNEGRRDQYQINDPNGRGDSFNQSLRQKRNEELVENYVRAYMPHIKSWTPKEIKCVEKLAQDRGKETEIVQCRVSGSIVRNALLPTFLDTASAGSVSIASEGLAYKTKSNPPLDVMIVADFSGSMAYRINDPFGNGPYGARDSKSNVLKAVLYNLSDNYLFKEKNTLNRIGFTAFSMGAKHPDISGQVHFDNTGFGNDTRNAIKNYPVDLNHMEENCVLPYQFKQSNREVEVYGKDSLETHNLIQFLTEYAPSPNWVQMNQAFAPSIDIDETINRVQQFDGSARHYSVIFKNHQINYQSYNHPGYSRCVGYNKQTGRYTPGARYWFDVTQKDDFKKFIYDIYPQGATLVTSGLLVGTNLMSDRSKHYSPDKIKTNTQRTIIILSDGLDQSVGSAYNTATPEQKRLENEFRGITGKLINAGVCDAIRSKLDSLQDPKYSTYPPKLAFIAFGYIPDVTNRVAWEKCVGKENYYLAHSEEELLKSFKSAVDVDAVGKSLVKPKF